jgi:putative Mg2+ transporter-C (MgtC) family protein
MMPVMLSVSWAHNAALIGRVAVGALLGALIGAERDLRGHPAGLRTFGLVALGSAALTTLSMDAFPASTDRLIAGIVTGVGFLGAGLVIRASNHVRNLTTAAASWLVAALGVLAGSGRFALAAASTVLALVLLEIRNLPGFKWLNPASPRFLRFHEDEGPDGDQA